MNKNNLGYQENLLAWNHLYSIILYKLLLNQHNNAYHNVHSNIGFSISKETPYGISSSEIDSSIFDWFESGKRDSEWCKHNVRWRYYNVSAPRGEVCVSPGLIQYCRMGVTHELWGFHQSSPVSPSLNPSLQGCMSRERKYVSCSPAQLSLWIQTVHKMHIF